MAEDVEKLLIRLEVSQRRFERQLSQASRSADRASNRMEQRFREANRKISRSFDRLGSSASAAFRTVSRLAVAAGLALSAREVAQYADAWTRVENKIKAAEQISGVSARTTSELNDLANESRAGLEETVDLYARLLRVAGDLGATEEDVARATEITAKAFKAGGAAASEQAAGILQLSQALSSGFLQGDELRSIRENAPLVARAIADEFETTIGGLKELGAEGQLTADRVFKAILNGAEDIEKAFDATTPTIADGFTALKNGATEFFGALSEGSGAGEGFTSWLSSTGGLMSDNAEAARRFGAQVSEAFTVIGEAFETMAGDINFGAVLSDIGETAENVIRIFYELSKSVVSTVTGVAAAIRQGFVNAIAEVASSGVAIANAAVSVIEGILNTIMRGIQNVIGGINSVIATANKIPGLDLPKFNNVLQIELERFDAPAIADQVQPIGDAFEDAANRARDAWAGWEDAAISAINRVKNAGSDVGSEGDTDQSGDTDQPSSSPLRPGKPGGKGGKGKAETPLFASIQKEVTALEDKIAMLGMTNAEMAEYEARQTLLNEAKKRGLDLDTRSAETGLTLREEINRQAETIGRLTKEYDAASERAQFFETAQQNLKDGFIDAIVEGESLSGVLEDLAKSLAKAALQATLFGEGPLAGVFGTSGGGGILGSIFGGIFGRATGGPVRAGQAYQVGEHGRELFVPRTDGQIVNASDVRQLSRGGGGSGGDTISISQSFSFAANGDESVKRIIAQEAPKIAAMTEKKVMESRRRGGAMKSAFSG